MSRKVTILFTSLLFLTALGCQRPEAVNWQDQSTQVSGDYMITYNLNKIEVAIGGKKYETTLDAIQTGGAKVGEITIPTEIAQKIEEQLAKDFNFQITGLGQITATNLDNNQTAKGLFFPKRNSFILGKADTIDPPTKNCGAIGGTLVSGDFIAAGIENGKTTLGFIAGCQPIIVGARATIGWTASKK